MEIDQGAVNEASAKIRFHRSALGIGADFHVRYVAQLTCFRCLCHFTREFNTDLYLTYVKGRDPYEDIEKVDLKKTDIDRIYYAGSRINVLVGLREAILLSLPFAILCTEACRGLCPVCGKNQNKETCSCPGQRTGLFTPTIRDQKKEEKKE